MEYVKAKVAKLLIDFFGTDERRINHALSVLVEAEKIKDKFTSFDYELLVAVALLHDVGIKPSEEKFGFNNGKTQEELGPDAAEKLLRSISFDEIKIIKAKEIIANHHSPSRYDYPELAILKEADKISNIREEKGEF